MRCRELIQRVVEHSNVPAVFPYIIHVRRTFEKSLPVITPREHMLYLFDCVVQGSLYVYTWKVSGEVISRKLSLRVHRGERR